jgi:hypothetical protein
LKKKNKKQIEKSIRLKGILFFIGIIILCETGFSYLFPSPISHFTDNLYKQKELIAKRIDVPEVFQIVYANALISEDKIKNKFNKKPYSVSISKSRTKNLAGLKKTQPVYFGWLDDKDKIFHTTITLKFNKDGYVKGKILPLYKGFVLYSYNGSYPDYNDSEYLNIYKIPVDFQFHGNKGEVRSWNLYTSRPVNYGLGRYADINFIPEN